MYWGNGHMGMGGWLLMAFMWGAALVGAFFLWRSMGSSRNDSVQTPLDILKARYARGEISREEFERVRKDIES